MHTLYNWIHVADYFAIGCISESTDHKKHFSPFLFCMFIIPFILHNSEGVGRKLDATGSLSLITHTSTRFSTHPIVNFV